jgi:hypothetical protein
MPRGVGVIASLICWGAGAYLLLGHTVLANSSITWVAHGIGIYFIAKGFFIAVVTHLENDMRDSLDEVSRALTYLAERESAREAPHRLDEP